MNSTFPFSFYPLLFLPCPVFMKIARKRSKAPLPRGWEIAQSLSVCLLYKHEDLDTISRTQVKSIKAEHPSTVKLRQDNPLGKPAKVNWWTDCSSQGIELLWKAWDMKFRSLCEPNSIHGCIQTHERVRTHMHAHMHTHTHIILVLSSNCLNLAHNDAF